MLSLYQEACYAKSHEPDVSSLVTWESDASNALYPAIWFSVGANTMLPMEQKFHKFPIYAVMQKEKKVYLKKNVSPKSVNATTFSLQSNVGDA